MLGDPMVSLLAWIAILITCFFFNLTSSECKNFMLVFCGQAAPPVLVVQQCGCVCLHDNGSCWSLGFAR